MQVNRPYVLTIAGFDPSGGAGLNADIKTMEQCNAYSLSLVTGITMQTENKFYSIEWRSAELVNKELEILLNNYSIAVIKFGIVPDLDFLFLLVSTIKKKSPSTKIVWDTVFKSTTGFDFQRIVNKETLLRVLNEIDLITPNKEEWEKITEVIQMGEIPRDLYCLIKSAQSERPGTDELWHNGKKIELESSENISSPKHGSGCVLSSAIASFLANGNSMGEACRKGKLYLEKFLKSNATLLGYHAA